jgi:hypothetical protein
VSEALIAEVPRSRYEKLQPRWCRLGKDQVAADQRRRLYEAMVEVTASRGYAALNVTLHGGRLSAKV